MLSTVCVAQIDATRRTFARYTIQTTQQHNVQAMQVIQTGDLSAAKDSIDHKYKGRF